MAKTKAMKKKPKLLIPAAKPKTVEAKKTLRRALSCILNTRVHQEYEGAEKLRQKYREIKGLDAQVDWLRKNIHQAPKPGRQAKGANDGSQANVGHQVSSTGVAERSVKVFTKSMATNSVACKRTLAIYGYIRALGLENKAPLPKLY
jgi:hypothetical protein